MVTFKNAEVFNFHGALRGMRNPLDSWNKADTEFDAKFALSNGEVVKAPLIGENDLDLACRLIKGGSEHRKFLRQIQVCVDITAPRYWWCEFDTYKVGTAANSCSTMHKLGAYEFTLAMFGLKADELSKEEAFVWDNLLALLEELRKTYNETKDLAYLRQMKRLLPEGFMQMRTVTFNYENILTMVKQRGNHRLTEWSKDMMHFLLSLPYAAEFCQAAGIKIDESYINKTVVNEGFAEWEV